MDAPENDHSDLAQGLDYLAEAIATLPATRICGELVHVFQQVELQHEHLGKPAAEMAEILRLVHDRIIRRLLEAGWLDEDEEQLRRMGRRPSSPRTSPINLPDETTAFTSAVIRLPLSERSEAVVRLVRRVEHHHDKSDRFRINAMEFSLIALQGRLIRRLVYAHWGEEPEERDYTVWR